MPVYAGVDLGATNVRAVVGDERGQVIESQKRSTPQGPDGDAVTEAILGVLRDACDGAGVAPTELVAVGVGSFGPLDLAAGVIEDPANLPDTVDRIPITEPIAALIGDDDTGNVYLHNDTNAGVIGERFYSDRNPDHMVYLTISSGIGAGVTVDGEVLDGWDGNAGEVGHTIVDPEGRMSCGCGIDGHWEAYCSGNNIPRYAARLHEDEGADTSLPIGDDEFTAADVFDAADAGDEFARDVLERTAHWNLIGIANIVHSYAPLIIYVGGAVAVNNPEWVIEPVQERLADHVMTNVPDVQKTTLGDEVVVKGTLASAITGGTGDRSRAP
ncbi:MAG: ROK family protein [Haloarculaceae archaeon]